MALGDEVAIAHLQGTALGPRNPAVMIERLPMGANQVDLFQPQAAGSDGLLAGLGEGCPRRACISASRRAPRVSAPAIQAWTSGS